MVRKSEWRQSLHNQFVIIPRQKDNIQMLEQRITELERALERATKKYAAHLELINDTSEDSSPCTLIVAGIILVGTTCVSWFL